MVRAVLILFSAFLGSTAWAGAPDRGAARDGSRGGPPRDGPPRDAPGAHALCPAAIGAVERSQRLPPALLGAIGTVESGRRDPANGKLAPWPWTVNAEGVGQFHRSKAEAIAAVEHLRAAGVRSIDVGCMQVNLMHHPDAFESLEQAFDPRANVGYAARFLVRLHRETDDWMQAAAAYHSRTPELGGRYRQKVAAVWPLAPRDAAPARTERFRVDPRGIYTPEFAARLLQDARDRAARDERAAIPRMGPNAAGRPARSGPLALRPVQPRPGLARGS